MQHQPEMCVLGLHSMLFLVQGDLCRHDRRPKGTKARSVTMYSVVHRQGYTEPTPLQPKSVQECLRHLVASYCAHAGMLFENSSDIAQQVVQ